MEWFWHQIKIGLGIGFIGLIIMIHSLKKSPTARMAFGEALRRFIERRW